MNEPQMPCSQCGAHNWMKHETPLFLLAAQWSDRRWVGLAEPSLETSPPKAVEAFECINCRHMMFYAADEPGQGNPNAPQS